MTDEVGYDVRMTLVQELLFMRTSQVGVEYHPVPRASVLGDDGEPDARLILAQFPPEAFGWTFQSRFTGELEHNGKQFQLTSGVAEHTGVTWVDARELQLEEVAAIWEQQQRYIAGRIRKNRPIGPLPHGKDRTLVLQALQRGERALVTRHGDQKWWDPTNDVLLETASIT